MKFIKEYMKEALLVQPLGEVTLLQDEIAGLSCENILINGKDTGISVAHIDYANWLENKIQELPMTEEVEDTFNNQDYHQTFDPWGMD